MNNIAQNLSRIRTELAEAALASGRDPDTVQLLAVSKTKPASLVAEAMDAGQVHFGENTIQDAQTKIPVLAERHPTWRFIGHLQTNKAKYIPGQFQWLHTLDSLELANKLSSRLVNTGAQLNALIQVNVTEDDAKHGVLPQHIDQFMDALLATALPGIRLRGLMTIGKATSDRAQIRKNFASLRALRDQLAHKYQLSQFDQLSMGMSDDFAEAIAEGATWVRIGSAIFGSRI